MSTKKRLVENITSLFVLQGISYLFPLITLPYLVRVLGPEKFGLLAFAQAFVQYFIILTDYGFNMSATREVAIHREDLEKCSTIFSAVMLIKLILLFVSAIIYTAIIFAIPYFQQEWGIYMLSFLAVIGNVLFPIWFFQGLEQMKYITFTNLLARGIMTGLIFVFAQNSNDYLVAAGLQSGTFLLAGILSIGILWKQMLVKPQWPKDWNVLKSVAQESNQVFLSSLSGSIYVHGPVVIVGLVAGQAAAGYYAIVQKISSAIVGLVQPIAQGLYPYLARQFQSSQDSYYKSQRLLSISGLSVAILFGAISFVFSEKIITLLSGDSSPNLIVLMQIFSITTSLIIINVLLNSSVLAMKLYAQIQNLYFKVAIAFLLLSFPVTYQFGFLGMAYLILAVELMVFFSLLQISSVLLEEGK